MIWTIGQPPGEMLSIATESNRIWREVLADSGIWFEECGALHIANHDDELAVLTEFASVSESLGYACDLVSPEDIARIAPLVRRENLRGGLLGRLELCVDPRATVSALPDYLNRTFGVEFVFGSAVTRVVDDLVGSPDRTILADRVVICNGDDFETLFPEVFRDAALSRCKLEMYRAAFRTPSSRIGPHLCAGLTLTHYRNFSICQSLAKLKARYEQELPEYVQNGIHLLVSQHEHGELTIGDTHAYGRTVKPFLHAHLERLVWSYLDTFIDASQFDITQRWHGVYATYANAPFFEHQINPRVQVVTGVGGAGMTLSFGLGERTAAMATAGVSDPPSSV